MGFTSFVVLEKMSLIDISEAGNSQISQLEKEGYLSVVEEQKADDQPAPMDDDEDMVCISFAFL